MAVDPERYKILKIIFVIFKKISGETTSSNITYKIGSLMMDSVVCIMSETSIFVNNIETTWCHREKKFLLTGEREV